MEQRAHNVRLLPVFGFLLAWPTLAAAASCYDLSKGQPAELTGNLDYVVFAGPPHYQNVRKGDAPNPSFVLRLAHPMCIQGNRSADPKTSFRAVQLVKTAEVEGKLKPLLHRDVTVTLKNPAPDPPHRQAPLFAWVAGIAPAPHPTEITEKRVPAPATHPMKVAKAQGTAATPTHHTEFTRKRAPAATTRPMKVAKAQGMAATPTHHTELTRKRAPAPATHHIEFAKGHDTAATTHQPEFNPEHGTAATTVRAFYAGLADGRGDLASAMVVPRKRAQGPFSADELSRFYGHLRKPIRLEYVETNGQGEVMVQYRYAASARECDGRAVVKTVVLSGKTYIRSINALDRC